MTTVFTRITNGFLRVASRTRSLSLVIISSAFDRLSSIFFLLWLRAFLSGEPCLSSKAEMALFYFCSSLLIVSVNLIKIKMILGRVFYSHLLFWMLGWLALDDRRNNSGGISYPSRFCPHSFTVYPFGMSRNSSLLLWSRRCAEAFSPSLYQWVFWQRGQRDQ